MTNRHWLLVVDNLEDVDILAMHNFHALAGEGRGQVIITTRIQTYANQITWGANVIVLDSPAEEEMVGLLIARLGSDRERELLFELVRAFDCLPLAVTQAATYIRTRNMSVSRYLSLYKESTSNRIKLLDHAGYSNTENSVCKTVELSVNHVRMNSLQAFELLALISLFDRKGIPDYLLLLYFDNDDLAFEDAAEILVTCSLVTRSGGFNMHGLVQAVIVHHLQVSGELTQWMEKSVELMNSAFPVPRHENWMACASLLPHAKAVLQHRLQDSSHQAIRANILFKVGEYQYSQGNYAVAEVDLKGAISVKDVISGPENPDTLSCMSLLGLVLTRGGKYLEAEKITSLVLERQVKVLGKEHQDTLISMNNLAILLNNQGKYSESENVYRQTLLLMNKTLGEMHPDTLRLMDGFAGILVTQGKYTEAGHICEEALASIGRILGNDHPDELQSMHTLSRVRQGQGRYSEAEPLFRQTLALRENILGKEHPETLRSMNSLAGILQRQGKYNEADAICRQTLALREKVLGEEHPDTLQSMHNIATLLGDNGHYNEAEEMYSQTIAIMVKILGNDHPGTLRCERAKNKLLQSRRKRR